ncbi:hypothetical protein CEXT_629821 [Caerostris extrusa]|uniref:Uncharacterized protein n=1 Tax=Caerostris extrusa TaxID=172846 RepID=A0AAV4NHB8_CAEEX|nr:hypothetical protein CEXT_629821 [Caerostris extrusa]
MYKAPIYKRNYLQDEGEYLQDEDDYLQDEDGYLQDEVEYLQIDDDFFERHKLREDGTQKDETQGQGTNF